jgi:hypothetical protein
MSLMAKLKALPTSYWVLGLGSAALGVDYLVEGQNSIASAIWRGVTGGHKEVHHGGQHRMPFRHPRAALPSRVPPLAALPQMQQQVVEELALPQPMHHRYRHFFPAYDAYRPYAHHDRLFPAYEHGFGRRHEGPH